MIRIVKCRLLMIIVTIIFSGLLTTNLIAQQYTGRGVPVDANTGLPALNFPVVSDGTIYSVVPDGSGGWFIGGSFTMVGGVSRNAVARINADGTINESWNANIGAGGIVYAMAIGGTGNSRLYLGGSFSSVGGSPRNNIAAVSVSNGALDTWYLATGANGTVYAITMTFSNNVIFGGDFTYTVGASTYVNLIQINNAGNIATQVGSLSPVNGTVRTLAFGSQLSLYVGGDFTTFTSLFGTVNRSRIARIYWNVDFGYLLADWNPGADATVRAVRYITNDFSPDVIVAGDFTTIGGESRNNIARVSWDGNVTNWNPSIAGTQSSIHTISLASLDAGTIYIGGNFESVGSESRNNLAAIDVLSGTPTNWNPYPDDIVRAIAATTSYVYVGGDFDYMGTPSSGFSVTPGSIDFGTVGVGAIVTDSVVITNTGAANLVISSVVSSAAEFDVSPTSASIAPSESETFYITFSSAVPGTFSGDITFTHNAPGSPSDVPVTGEATDVSLLLFTSDYHLRIDEQAYTDTLRLLYNGSSGLKGLQFKLRSNPLDAGSAPVLNLVSVEKGSDIASANWNLFYELKETGESDYIIVLLYGEDLTTLPAGTYNDFIRFHYETANVAGVDTLRSYFRLEEVYSSLSNGDPAGVIGDDDQVIDVYGEAFYGDINMDGSVDIQDLILIREYILERITFTSEEFVRADIAPWTAGSPTPSPDGLVNIQDLALLQYIILTGLYPDGSPAFRISSPNSIIVHTTSALNSEATLTFTVKNDCIDVHSSSNDNIIGIQLQISNISTEIQDLKIETTLGNAFYHYTNETLRILLYDRSGQAVLSTGDNHIARIPLSETNQKNIRIEELIIINSDLEKIPNINIKTVYDGNLNIPSDYHLYQNFPNPFNPTTFVEFSIPRNEFVVIKIYDMLGQEIRTLFSGQVESGTYRAQWDGLNDAGLQMSSGNYIYRMQAGDFVQTKKMTLLK